MSSNKFKEVPFCLKDIEDIALHDFHSIVYDELGEAIENDDIALHDEILIVLRKIKTEIQNRNEIILSPKQELNDFLEHIETSISEYDNELKHTVNGKKEYVFNDNEFVGESTLKFIPKAQDVINKNKYTYDLFIKTLDIKFPNILIIKSTPYILHYKLKGKLNV